MFLLSNLGIVHGWHHLLLHKIIITKWPCLGKDQRLRNKATKKKNKIPTTKRNHYNKVSRSKSVNNNRRKLEKRINFYRVQNICNHFHRQNSGTRRREYNNTPVHKKSHSINEPAIKGVAPVPSRTVRHPDSEVPTQKLNYSNLK